MHYIFVENSKSAFRTIISEWLLKDMPQAKERDITDCMNIKMNKWKPLIFWRMDNV